MTTIPRFAAEALEQRIAPAGVIQVVVRGVDLFLTSDRAVLDHALEITPGEDGALVITPLGSTLLRVGREAPSDGILILHDPIRDIHYTGGAGADQLQLTDLHTIRNVTAAFGAGDNILAVSQSDVLGTLRVTGAGATNQVFIRAEDEVTTIAKDFTLLFTRGENYLFADGAGLQIGGSLSYRSGSGTDDVNVVPSRLDILGSLELAAGRGNAYLNASGIAGAAIHGVISIRTSTSGEESTAVGFGGNGEFFFGGEVRYLGSSGGDDLAFDAGKLTFAKGLTTKMGGGANSVSLRGAEIAVAGSLKLAAEGMLRAEVIATARLQVEGSITQTAKRGEDSFTLQGVGLVRGKVTLALGDGASQTILRGSVETGRLVLQGGLAITSGALADLVGDQAVAVEIINVVLNGRTTIKTGAGADNIYFYDGGAINAPTVVNTGGNADGVHLFSRLSPLVVNAPVTVLAGGDTDFISLGSEGAITANALITMIGGAGMDTLDYRTYGNILSSSPRTSGVELIT